MSDTDTDTRPAEAADPAEDDLMESFAHRTMAMYAAARRLTDPEINALFDAVLVARGTAAKDARPNLVAYFERMAEWLMLEFVRRDTRPAFPRRARRPEHVRARLGAIKPDEDA